MINEGRVHDVKQSDYSYSQFEYIFTSETAQFYHTFTIFTVKVFMGLIIHKVE